MRSLHGLLYAASIVAFCNPADAGSTVDYSISGGRTSNVFKDPALISSPFGEARLAFRGSLSLEDSQLAYGLTASVRRIARYHFADERRAGVEIGYMRELGEGVKLTLKGGIEHRRDGDLFLALPGLLIGYSKADVAGAASAGDVRCSPFQRHAVEGPTPSVRHGTRGVTNRSDAGTRARK